MSLSSETSDLPVTHFSLKVGKIINFHQLLHKSRIYTIGLSAVRKNISYFLPRNVLTE